MAPYCEIRCDRDTFGALSSFGAEAVAGPSSFGNASSRSGGEGRRGVLGDGNGSPMPDSTDFSDGSFRRAD